jgi:hypothetical protein
LANKNIKLANKTIKLTNKKIKNILKNIVVDLHFPRGRKAHPV